MKRMRDCFSYLGDDIHVYIVGSFPKEQHRNEAFGTGSQVSSLVCIFANYISLAPESQLRVHRNIHCGLLTTWHSVWCSFKTKCNWLKLLRF